MRGLQKKSNFTSFFDPSKGKTFSGFLIEGSSGGGSDGNGKRVDFKIESGKIDKIKELKSKDESSSSSSSSQEQKENLLISLKEVPYCDENGETGFILLMCSDPYSESIEDSFEGYSGISNEDEGEGSSGGSNPWDLG
jgi:hypothetical protein